jgi:hypothetical protein
MIRPISLRRTEGRPRSGIVYIENKIKWRQAEYFIIERLFKIQKKAKHGNCHAAPWAISRLMRRREIGKRRLRLYADLPEDDILGGEASLLMLCGGSFPREIGREKGTGRLGAALPDAMGG